MDPGLWIPKAKKDFSHKVYLIILFEKIKKHPNIYNQHRLDMWISRVEKLLYIIFQKYYCAGS